MQIFNDRTRYGSIAIALHWWMALLIALAYGFGLILEEIDYVNRWYQWVGSLHVGLGVFAGIFWAVRLAWRLVNPRPELPGRAWEQKLALLAHRTFYVLIAAVVATGYLITTADGSPVSVFGWFEIPALFAGAERQEDIAGELHEWLADALVVLVGLHVAGALKHHWLDRDDTLRRMWPWGRPRAGEA